MTPALKQMLRQLCGEQHRAQDGSRDQSGVQGGGARGQQWDACPGMDWAVRVPDLKEEPVCVCVCKVFIHAVYVCLCV